MNNAGPYFTNFSQFFVVNQSEFYQLLQYFTISCFHGRVIDKIVSGHRNSYYLSGIVVPSTTICELCRWLSKYKYISTLDPLWLPGVFAQNLVKHELVVMTKHFSRQAGDKLLFVIWLLLWGQHGGGWRRSC